MTRRSSAKDEGRALVVENSDPATNHLWPWSVQHDGFAYVYTSKAAAASAAKRLNASRTSGTTKE